MPWDLNDMIPSRGEISTLHVALEVNDRSWVLAIGAPLESGPHGGACREDWQHLRCDGEPGAGSPDLRGRP